MIGSVISAELLKLRRSWVVAVTLALAAIGPALVGAVTWSALALERTDLPLPLPDFDVTWTGFLGQGVGYSSLFVLFGLTLATAYLYGSEYQNDTVEVTLSGSARSEEIVIGRFIVLVAWTVLLAAFVFAASVILGLVIGLGPIAASELGRGFSLQAMRAAELMAGLPLIAWVAIRARGMILPIAAGVIGGSLALVLNSGLVPHSVPWLMGAIPSAPASLWSTLVAPLVVFVVGAALCLVDMRRRDVG